MYYLIEQLVDGQLDVRAYTKRDLEIEIKARFLNGQPHKFVKDLDYYPFGYTLLINGDIIVPREKRVVVEYEVE